MFEYRLNGHNVIGSLNLDYKKKKNVFILIIGKLIDEDDAHLSLSVLFMNQTNKNLQSLILLESNKNYNRKSIRPRGFRANNITRFSQIHNPVNAKKHLILLKNGFLLFVFKETIHQFDG